MEDSNSALERCGSCGRPLATAGAGCPCSPARENHDAGVLPAGSPDPDGGNGRVETRPGVSEDSASSPLNPSRYEILATLGRGLTSTVLKARDRELDEVIALKVLNPLGGTAGDALRMFRREVKLARRINHPHVARVYDLTEYEGRLAISLEFIEGRPLSDFLGTEPMPLHETWSLLRYLCSALQAAHDMSIVHRDLKPGNILMDLRRRPYLIDFGIAVLRGSGEEEGRVAGTPSYMAPEQFSRPSFVDPRTDIYALGALLYRMATGRMPFPTNHPEGLAGAFRENAIAPPRSLNPEVPEQYEQVILRCLSLDPADRFGSARELHEAVGRALAGRTTAPEIAAPRRPRARVLLVDDDRDYRRVVAQMMKPRTDLEVLEAGEGRRGVELALSEQPDLIFLDVNMPSLDGRETLRLLKKDVRTQGIPVVMLTSLTDPDEQHSARALGAAGFVNKPIAAHVLELLLEKHLP